MRRRKTVDIVVINESISADDLARQETPDGWSPGSDDWSPDGGEHEPGRPDPADDGEPRPDSPTDPVLTIAPEPEPSAAASPDAEEPESAPLRIGDLMMAMV